MKIAQLSGTFNTINEIKLMIIYLVGVSCVGKTTIGTMLSDILGFPFFDMDEEIEKYYQKSIERIQDECLTMNGFREKASIVLDYVLSKNDNSIISGTPSGLKYSYLQIYKKHARKREIVSIHIKDKPENILSRLTFYDKDSKPIKINLDESIKKKYLRKIIVDFNYFKDSYKRADIQLDISNTYLEAIPNMIIEKLTELE
jgi:shikimate kinase